MLKFIRTMFTPPSQQPAPKSRPRQPFHRSTRAIRTDVPKGGPDKQPESGLEADATSEWFGEAEENVDLGPDNRVMARRPRYQLETGSYETLAIVEDRDEVGVDPYNTGSFERRKTWDPAFHR